MKQQQKKYDLHGQYHRDAHGEFMLSRLVAEKQHPGQRADTAADHGRQDQRGLRNAPESLFCAMLVDPHQRKRDEVHDFKICQNHTVLSHGKKYTPIFLRGQPMKTVKLYYQDAYIREFTARILSCEPRGEGFSVVLDQTAFFPEEGGQAADTGALDGVRVTDAHEKDGCIFHYTDAPLAVGQTVTGALDWAERFRKMQDHTGEHIVSGLIHRRFGFENVGFHLGADRCTVDFDGELTRGQLDEIEDAANAAVWENRAVTTSFPAPEELPALSYRAKLDLTENVRLVTIEGVDVCACCAPHVSRTGEVGLIKFLDFMRHRGGTRVWLKCGFDALADYRARYTDSARLSAMLNAPQDAIVPAAEKLFAQRDELKYRLGALERKMLEQQAAAIEETDGNILLFSEADDAGMRLLANAGMEKCGGVCAVFSGADGDFRFVLASRSMDIRAFVKEHREALSLRGGGQERMVSGRCGAARETLTAFFSNGKGQEA